MKTIRTLLVDDHAITRMGLRSVLRMSPDIAVVGEAEDGESAIRQATRLKPDVVVMDLMMPGMDGADVTRELVKALPLTHILILTTFGTADGIGYALQAGALGAVMKNIRLPDLVQAIRTVNKGQKYLSPEIEQILKEDPPAPELSPRQSEILASIARGLSNDDIAQLLGISTSAVKQRLTVLFAKLGAANRTEAAAIALKKQLLKL